MGFSTQGRVSELTDVGDQTHGFQGQVMHETVLLGDVVGDVQGIILLFLLLDDLGTQLVLEGAVTGQIHQERGEDEAGDVDVGEEDFDEGLEELEEEKKLWLGNSFVRVSCFPGSVRHIPQSRSSRAHDQRPCRFAQLGRRASAATHGHFTTPARSAVY